MSEIMSKTNIVAVVPAAGSGSRMKSEQPKQYLKINNLTILEHTLHTLLSHADIDRVIVAISPTDCFFSTLPIANDPRVIAINGGNTRAESVLAGLEYLADDEWALVHDAARPCLSHSDMDKLIYTVLNEKQGGILAIPVTDTIKQANINNTVVIDKSVDRTYLWAAVTPQLFNAHQLKNCLQQALADQALITDEASAIEYCGGHPLLIAGRRDNIKVTQPEDIAIATFYLTNNNQIIKG